MAFTSDTLSVIVQPIGGTGIRFLSYRSDDSVATITGSGYFTRAATFGVRKYDLIFVMPIAGSVESYILIVSDINAITGNGTAVIEPAIADGSIGYEKLLPAIATLIQNALQPAAIGTTVQPYSANLTTLAGVVPGALGLALLDDLTASAAQTTLGISAFIKTLIDDATDAAARATLNLTQDRQIVGLTFSNNVADATNDIDIAAGSTISEQGVLMTLAAGVTRQLDVVYGTGNGGRFDAAISDGWWHVFEISNGTTVSIGMSKSVVPTGTPNYPGGYTNYRRIFSIDRISGVIAQVRQYGNTFKRAALRNAYNSTAAKPTALTLMHSPVGIVAQPILLITTAPSASSTVLVQLGDGSGASAQELVQNTNSAAGIAQTYASWINGGFFTNTAGQLHHAVTLSAGTATSVFVDNWGWIDDRGQG